MMSDELKELTGAEILEADDLTTKLVAVPEWKGAVRIRVMAGVDRDAFEKSMMKFKGDAVERDVTNARAKLVARCVCDKEGRRLFNESQIEALGRKNQVALSTLAKECQILNGMDDESKEATLKNSDAPDGNGSLSDASLQPESLVGASS